MAAAILSGAVPPVRRVGQIAVSHQLLAEYPLAGSIMAMP